MATSRISNTIKAPDGTAIASVPVTVMLMPSAGFRESDFTEVARIASTTTNASGFWQLDLERNANITPDNSWYEVVEQVPAASGGRRVWNIAVGDSDQTLLASLVTPAEQQPTVVPAGTVYLDQASADARYQALGSLGSATPAQVDAGDAGTAGVSSSAARQDHEHPVAITSAQLVPAATIAAWASWTPTFTNFTLGNGTLTAAYMQVGKTVHYRLSVTLGSTSSVSGDMHFTLPVNRLAAYGITHPIGQVDFGDTGTADYHGVVWAASATQGRLIVFEAASTHLRSAATSSTIPFTWTTADTISVSGFYEAA